MIAVDGLAANGFSIRGRVWASCHLVADTEAELYAAAGRLGLDPKWAHRSALGGVLHFDLVRRLRQRAIALGAVRLDRKGMGMFCRGRKIAECILVYDPRLVADQGAF